MSYFKVLRVMADVFIQCLSLLIVSTGTVISDECKGCFIGSGWQNSPCSECCCDRNIPKSENCCYKVSDNNKATDEGPIQGTFIYFVAALCSLIFVTVFLFCCFRCSDTKCCHLFGNNGNGPHRRSTRERSTNCNLNDNPPAYDSIELQELQIVVPKSPPYMKDPPPYTETFSNPTDVGECINN